MRLSLLIVVFACCITGCGTLQNVTARPGTSTGWQGAGPTACVPFGGVQRSVMGGSMLAFGFNPLGVGAATVAVGVDAPLSLAGDVVTLPYVLARNRGERWANAWDTPEADSRLFDRQPTGGPTNHFDAQSAARTNPNELVAPAAR